MPTDAQAPPSPDTEIGQMANSIRDHLISLIRERDPHCGPEAMMRVQEASELALAALSAAIVEALVEGAAEVLDEIIADAARHYAEQIRHFFNNPAIAIGKIPAAAAGAAPGGSA